MAVTNTFLFDGPTTKVVGVEATADADTGTTIPHGLTVEPEIVLIMPAAAEARISDWIFVSKNATNVVLAKTTDAGSGVAGDQLLVFIQRPHSIVR